MHFITIFPRSLWTRECYPGYVETKVFRCMLPPTALECVVSFCDHWLFEITQHILYILTCNCHVNCRAFVSIFAASLHPWLRMIETTTPLCTLFLHYTFKSHSFSEGKVQILTCAPLSPSGPSVPHRTHAALPEVQNIWECCHHAKEM